MATSRIDTYRRQLHLLGERVLDHPFSRWWAGELAALVPSRFLERAHDFSAMILVEVTPQSVILSKYAGGRFGEIGRLDVQGGEIAARKTAFQRLLEKVGDDVKGVALCLPPEQVLFRTIELPLAAEENLRQVIAFQMDLYTPFTAEQVYFDCRAGSRDLARNQLRVDLAVVRRGVLDAGLALLSTWGVFPRAAVLAEDAARGGRYLNLLPVQRRPRARSTAMGVNRWLSIFALLLAATALALPVIVKREAVGRMMPVVDKAKKAAEATEALRRDLENRVNEHNFLLEKKQQRPPVIAVLEELTHVLPDDTWVQQFDIKGDELQIQGETASSSKLIGLFAQSKMFQDAGFRSPLTKGQGAGSERFHLAATIKPLPPKQPKPPAAPAASPPQAAPVQPSSTPSTVPSPHAPAKPGVPSAAAPQAPAAPAQVQPSSRPTALPPTPAPAKPGVTPAATPQAPAATAPAQPPGDRPSAGPAQAAAPAVGANAPRAGASQDRGSK